VQDLAITRALVQVAEFSHPDEREHRNQGTSRLARAGEAAWALAPLHFFAVDFGLHGSDGHFVVIEFAHNSNRLVDKDIATLPHSLLYRKIL
jgi:hypothetical protein